MILTIRMVIVFICMLLIFSAIYIRSYEFSRLGTVIIVIKLMYLYLIYVDVELGTVLITLIFLICDFQAVSLGSLSDMDDLASTFAKVSLFSIIIMQILMLEKKKSS